MVSRKRTAAAMAALTTAGGLTLSLAGAARAQRITPEIVKGGISIELEQVASGLNQPNTLTHAGDGTGRRFIAERNGVIRILGGSGVSSTPFLDASSRVLTGGERGLLGLAFHPGYADPLSSGFGKFYTYTSEAADATADFASPNGGPTDHHSVVTEWSAVPGNPNVADPNSRREVLRIAQPQSNHNGGALAFSPTDGQLYIALGDGGNADDIGPGHTPGIGNGRDTTNVLGDILRINPLNPTATPTSAGAVSANGRYRIPSDNPFLGSNPGADEIYASGFRNPFRMSFDAADGRLLAGDVGQGTIEEVDIVVSGGNYGWNQKEGSYRFTNGTVSANPEFIPGLIDPVLQYDHDEGISVIGGFVYRGSEMSSLVGKYVFGDFNGVDGPLTSSPRVGGRIFLGDLATGEITELKIGDDDRGFGFGVTGFSRNLIAFGEDEDRELYALRADGTVFRLRATASSAAIPEPGTLALLGAGLLLGGTAAVRRRAR